MQTTDTETTDATETAGMRTVTETGIGAGMRMTGIGAPAQTAGKRRRRTSLQFPVIRDCCNNPVSDARNRE